MLLHTEFSSDRLFQPFLTGPSCFQRSSTCDLLGPFGGTHVRMLRPIYITAIIALLVALTVTAVMAFAHTAPSPEQNGTYIPSIHCKNNPELEGCKEDAAAMHPPTIGKYFLMPLYTLIAAAIVWVAWQIGKLPDPVDRAKILIGIVVGVVLWVCKNFIFP